MKRLAIVMATVALGLGGCASGDYKLYAQTQLEIAKAQSEADKAKYAALSEIAATGDPTAQVAAVITLNNNSSSKSSVPVSQPEGIGDKLLKWGQLIIPSATQLFSISQSTSLAKTQSNNNKDIAINTNRSFVDMGRLAADQTIPNYPVIVDPVIIEDAEGNQSLESPEVVYPQ